MLWAKINQNNEVVQWPIWDHQIVYMFPGAELPPEAELETADLSWLGLVAIPPTPAPEPSEGTKIVLDTPVFENGVWVRRYKEEPLNPPTP